MKTKKWITFVVIACFAVITVFVLLWHSSRDDISPGLSEPDNVFFEDGAGTAIAELTTVMEWYDAVGTVQPRSQARIEAQVSAQVIDVRVNAGDDVTEGQLLVMLDGRQMQARLAQAKQSLQSSIAGKEQARQAVHAAEAAFSEAESAYKRIKSFYEADAATKQDMEQAYSRYLQSRAALKRSEDGFSGTLSGVRMAKEMLQEAQIRLDYTEINAPAAGEVLECLVDPGDLAMPGKPLILLRTKGGLRLEAYVRESLIQKVRPGLILRVELTTLRQTVDARVEELIPYADPLTRTFLVKATLPDITGLYPGMYGKLFIPYKEVTLVLIPQETIYTVGQLELVMVKTDYGWARRYIKTGNVYGNKIEVLSGLSGNEILKIKESGNGI